VLYDVPNQHVKMSCRSAKLVNATTPGGCLSDFASNVAGGQCEYCCMTAHCNDDWTLARVRDDCREQSAAAAVHHSWPIIAAAVVAVRALLLGR